MTDGTSQGLFVVVAIVIFGIFVALSYTVFGNQLSPGISGLFENAIEKVDSDLTYTRDFAVNGNFSDYREVSYGWDETLNGNLRPNGNWSSGYNSGVPDYTLGYHAHLDIDTFGKPVMSFKNRNHSVEGVGYNRWLGVSKHFEPDSPIYGVLEVGSEIVVSFDLWSEEVNTNMRVGIYQIGDTGSHTVVRGIPRIYLSTTEEKEWERVEARFTVTEHFDFDEFFRIFIHGYHHGYQVDNYIDNVSVRVKR